MRTQEQQPHEEERHRAFGSGISGDIEQLRCVEPFLCVDDLLLVQKGEILSETGRDRYARGCSLR